MESELSAKVGKKVSKKAVISTEGKRIEIVMDVEKGDDRLSGTSRTMTNVTMVPPILVAGLRPKGVTAILLELP